MTTKQEKWDRESMEMEMEIVRQQEAEELERLRVEVPEFRKALHDAAMFLESADWKLGIHRPSTPWDDDLRALTRRCADLAAGGKP